MSVTGWRKREIMEMAREAQLPYFYQTGDVANLKQLEAFAELVRADEREACAKLAAKTVCDVHIPTGVKIYGTVAAKAIRARGKHD